MTSWGSLLRRDHFCGRTSLPINDLSPCTCPCHMEGGRGEKSPMCKRQGKTLFPLCCVVFNKTTNVVPPHLLASLFLQFEKFYVKLSVCSCLISVEVSEFTYFEIYLRKQLKRTQKEHKVRLYQKTLTPAVLQLQMEIVYNVNAEFPFNSTENII